MKKRSAGLMMYRWVDSELEVLLVHPGGPYFARKDEGAWTIPKGGFEIGESPLETARREFEEETGFPAAPPFLDLGSIRQVSGKLVMAFAFEGDCDPSELKSNLCTIDWPPRSGKTIEVPEVDRGAWFSMADARRHIREDQMALLDRLSEALVVTEM